MAAQLSTPVLFLIFNRPDTTQEVFNQIRSVRPKYLYVAADGPRPNVDGEIKKSNKAKEIIDQVDWDCIVKTLYRTKNLGCKYAVSSAITWFFDHVEQGIILEDDCFPDTSFFYYCEELLEKYKNNEEIYLIGGNYYERKNSNWAASYYFSYYSHIWGWASWRRVWKNYDVEMKAYAQSGLKSNNFKTIFNYKREFRYWKKIFDKTSANKINTWDYQFAYTIWSNMGISINPVKNLVINLGLKNNSTHYFLNDSVKSGLKCESVTLPLVHPEKIKIDKDADKFTYNNLIGISYGKVVRILKENSIKDMLLYAYKKFK